MNGLAQPLSRAPTEPGRLDDSSHRRLVARTVPVDSLDARTINACYRLFDLLYERTDRIRFERDLSEKQLIILLTDPADGTVRGFSTVHLDNVVHRGRPSRLVYSGDTAIHPDYWGQKRLQREFSRLLAREKLRHPTRPLLWFLISKGYKTYLLIVHHCPKSFPRYDLPPDRALQETLDVAARKRHGRAFNSVTGVVSYPKQHEHVRREVAPLNGPLLRDPHISFFASRNPGHAQGDELACLAEIRLIDPLRTIALSWWRSLTRRWRR